VIKMKREYKKRSERLEKYSFKEDIPNPKFIDKQVSEDREKADADEENGVE